MDSTTNPGQGNSRHVPWQGGLLDLLVIYVLPSLYLTMDLIVGGLAWNFYPATLSTWVVGGMVSYALSRSVRNNRINQITRGVLIVLGAGYYLIGIALLLPSLIAFIMFGRLGFLAVIFSLVPILAGHRLLLRSKALKFTENRSFGHVFIGATLTLANLACVLAVELIGDRLRYNDLVSDDRGRVLRALSSGSWYSPRDIFGHRSSQIFPICSEMKLSYLNDKQLQEAVEFALKLTPNDSISEKCERHMYE